MLSDLAERELTETKAEAPRPKVDKGERPSESDKETDDEGSGGKRTPAPES